MDVTRQNFNATLPFILEDIANADFVAIDLEFSGIPGQQPNKPKWAFQGSTGLPTLQERYTDIKNAAEKYQVLQLGITCASTDPLEGKYVLKPYNFFLNPLPDSRLDIERTIQYQSGAVEFLLSHGFRMEAPYLEGVPYLSRTEEAIARRNRRARSAMPDIEISETDLESVLFLEQLRGYIDTWRSGRELRSTDYLNIPPATSTTSQLSDRGLNGFQKRLVHQYVRSYHPDLVTVSRSGFIQLLPYDKAREDAVQARKDRGFEQSVEAQIGLRWLVEALTGGSLKGLTTGSFRAYVEGREEEVAQSLSDLKAMLGDKRTILVGHNAFTDLVYFHQCFFGQLPGLVEDFQRTMHQLFPVIIDTKYLATANDVNPVLVRSSLEELDNELLSQDFPVIELHENHSKYSSDKPVHEAGYDSFLTAKVIIRLASKLEHLGQYVDMDQYLSSETYFTSPESGGVPIVVPKASASSEIDLPASLEEGGVPINGDHGFDPPPSEVHTSPAKRSRKKAKEPSRFSHAGRYDVLEDLDLDFQEASISESHGSTKAAAPSDHEFTMMPRYDSHFWVVYGNKLRVNGTVEGVCDMLGESLEEP